MKSVEEEFLESFLGIFNSEHYTTAIKNIRQSINSNPRRMEEWAKVSKLISLRGLPSGKPLALVHHISNQVLDDNTDEEAWRWLELMVVNVEQLNDKITSY